MVVGTEKVQDLGVAGVGRLAAERELRPVRAPDLLVDARVVEEAVTGAPRLDRHVRGPQARTPCPRAKLVHERRGRVVLTLERVLVRVHVLLHERPIGGARLEVRGGEEARHGQ